MIIHNPFAFIPQLPENSKLTYVVPTLCLILVVFLRIKKLFMKKRKLIKVTFRQNTLDTETGELIAEIKASLFSKIFRAFIIFFVLTSFFYARSFQIHILALLLFLLVCVARSLFEKILIYDNAIVHCTLPKKTVLFKNLDFMTNVGLGSFFRNVSSGYKFVKGNKQVFFFRNENFNHLEQFEEIFRAHPAVEKYEEQPSPDSKILETD